MHREIRADPPEEVHLREMPVPKIMRSHRLNVEHKFMLEVSSFLKRGCAPSFRPLVFFLRGGPEGQWAGELPQAYSSDRSEIIDAP